MHTSTRTYAGGKGWNGRSGKARIAGMAQWPAQMISLVVSPIFTDRADEIIYVHNMHMSGIEWEWI